MKAKYALENIRIYEKNNLMDSSEGIYLINVLSTEYIRDYRNGLNNFKEPEEKEVLLKLLSHCERQQKFKRCEQIRRILNGEPLGNLPVIVPE